MVLLKCKAIKISGFGCYAGNWEQCNLFHLTCFTHQGIEN
jgi:hypothetical protein